MIKSVIKQAAPALIAALAGLAVSPVTANAAQVSVTLQNHAFSPAELSVPADQPVTIIVRNLDNTPSEFESKTLRVEKVVKGGGTISVQVRPLAPGRYRFFDDYHEDTTEGYLTAQ